MAWKTRPPDQVPVGLFMQDKVWVTGDNEVMDVDDIEEGHLQNLISWMKRHKNDIVGLINQKYGAGHLATWKWPLLKRLERIAKDRDSAPGALNAAFESRDNEPLQTEVDWIEFIRELNKRGYDVVKIPLPAKAPRKSKPSPSSGYDRDY